VYPVGVSTTPDYPDYGWTLHILDAEDLTEGDTVAIATWTTDTLFDFDAAGAQLAQLVMDTTGAYDGGKAVDMSAASTSVRMHMDCPELVLEQGSTMIYEVEWMSGGGGTDPSLQSGITTNGHQNQIYYDVSGGERGMNANFNFEEVVDVLDLGWGMSGGVFFGTSSKLIENRVIKVGNAGAYDLQSGIRIGGHYDLDSSSQFKGKISKVWIWEGPLTEVEVEDFLYNHSQQYLPTDQIASFDHTTAKWQDTGGTTAADTHTDPVDRIDNDGSLGGFFTLGVGQPLLDIGTRDEEMVEFFGIDYMTLPDAASLTPATTVGFEMHAVVQSVSAATDRGVCGKWGGSTNEWRATIKQSASPNEVETGVSGYENAGDATELVDDGKLHILSMVIYTDDTVQTFIDGKAVAAAPTTITTMPTNGTSLLYLGSYTNSTSQAMTGFVGELHVFDRTLDILERLALFTKMRKTWKILAPVG
jgi:hypothetical protein